jgi:hypothetical protein
VRKSAELQRATLDRPERAVARAGGGPAAWPGGVGARVGGHTSAGHRYLTINALALADASQFNLEMSNGGVPEWFGKNDPPPRPPRQSDSRSSAPSLIGLLVLVAGGAGTWSLMNDTPAQCSAPLR